MMTLKQLEALYWVVKLSGFSAAARQLNASQSTVSKRLQELEKNLGITLLSGDSRPIMLTDQGLELYTVARQMLEIRDNVLLRLSEPGNYSGILRLGVTELTAVTWLTDFLRAMAEEWPNVSVEPVVDMSLNLREMLLAESVDMVIVPDAWQEDFFNLETVGTVVNGWFCAPQYLSGTTPVSLIRDLNNHRLLLDKSGPGIIYKKWFISQGISPASSQTSNSMNALLAMALSGLGITYFPKTFIWKFVDQGLLVNLDVTPALPDVNYVAMTKKNINNFMYSSAISLAKKHFKLDKQIVFDLSI
ncbi:LysR family transcriptional regulator [Pectobacterium carotovorum]